MIRDAIAEAMRNKREFAASFLTLLLLYGAVFAIYIAGAGAVQP